MAYHSEQSEPSPPHTPSILIKKYTEHSYGALQVQFYLQAPYAKRCSRRISNDSPLTARRCRSEFRLVPKPHSLKAKLLALLVGTLAIGCDIKNAAQPVAESDEIGLTVEGLNYSGVPIGLFYVNDQWADNLSTYASGHGVATGIGLPHISHPGLKVTINGATTCCTPGSPRGFTPRLQMSRNTPGSPVALSALRSCPTIRSRSLHRSTRRDIHGSRSGTHRPSAVLPAASRMPRQVLSRRARPRNLGTLADCIATITSTGCV